MGKRRPYFFTFVVCLTILSLRAVMRVWDADIWGEDALFLSEALRFGVPSLLIPYAGSFHTLQRLFCFGLIPTVPVSLWPLVITTSSLLFLAYVSAEFSKPTYAWIVPSRRVRIMLCTLIPLAPGLNEMAGNLANLNWLLFFWLAFRLLRDPKVSLSVGEGLFSLLILFSIGTSIALLPLMAWRARFRQKCRFSPRWEISILATTILVLVGLFLLSQSQNKLGDTYVPPAGSHSPTGAEIIAQGPIALLRTTWRSVAFRPWLGSGLASSLVDMGRWPAVAWAWQIGFLLYAFFWFRRDRHTPRGQALFSLLIPLCLWPLPTWFARPGSMGVFYSGGYWHYRYAFPLAVGALLFWVGSFRKLQLREGRKLTACGVFLFCGYLHSVDRFPIREYRFVHAKGLPHWRERSEPLKLAITKGPRRGTGTVATFPSGWHIDY